jgi:hypothetical protein
MDTTTMSTKNDPGHKVWLDRRNELLGKAFDVGVAVATGIAGEIFARWELGDAARKQTLRLRHGLTRALSSGHSNAKA